jgi:hypothetical protein
MNIARRLDRLESATLGDGKPKPDEFDLAELLRVYAAVLHKREPDFPRALQFCADALRQAQAQSDPPWDPPDDVEPGDTQRVEHYRSNEWRFPAVDEGRMWLVAMLHRTLNGKPPVIESEFYDLERWYLDNEKCLASNPGLLDLGNGKGQSSTNMRYFLSLGPRDYDAGEWQEKVRKLKRLWEQLNATIAGERATETVQNSSLSTCHQAGSA